MSDSTVFRTYAKSLLTVLAVLSFSIAGSAQTSDNAAPGKDLDVRSSVGDLHVGSAADARDLGLPIYPGARLKHEGDSKNSANFALFTAAFGMKLIVANYDSDESPSKLVTYYRDRLKKYGKVLECRTNHSGNELSLHEDDGDSSSSSSKQVKCEGDQTGSVVELKVGTENNQHIVAIKAGDSGKGSEFALVYVHTRGKQGDI